MHGNSLVTETTLEKFTNKFALAKPRSLSIYGGCYIPTIINPARSRTP